jgi:hypothetical protein
MVRRVLLCPDPNLNLSTSQYLYKIYKIKESIEEKLFIAPLLKKVTENSCCSIVLSETSNNISGFGHYSKISRIEVTTQREPSHALNQAMRIHEEWQQYGHLPTLLRVNEIDMGEILKVQLVSKLYETITEIDRADRLLAKENPDEIYIQGTSLRSKVFYHTSKHHQIEPKFVQPKIWRGVEQKARDRLGSSSRKDLFKSVGVYKITNNFPKKYVVLASVPYINYLTAVLPVLDQLSNQNLCDIYVFGRDSDIAQKIDHARKVDITNPDMEEYERAVRELRSYYISELKHDPRFQDLFKHNGINMLEILHNEMKQLLGKDYITLGSNAAYFQEVVQKIKPDILIVGCEVAIVNWAHVLLAKSKGIPILEVQHGIFTHLTPIIPPISDKCAVGGEYYREIYLKGGAKNDQVVVTGWPKLDGLADQLNRDLSKPRREVLFATQPLDLDLNLKVIETIGTCFDRLNSVHLIVKPHPREDPKAYAETCALFKSVILRSNQENTTSLVASTDVLITVSSTVALEAVLLDKPIVCLNMSNDESVYISSGVALNVTKYEDIVPAIKDALHNDEIVENLADARKVFTYQHTYHRDGKASKRVADLAISMIENNKRGRMIST